MSLVESGMRTIDARIFDLLAPEKRQKPAQMKSGEVQHFRALHTWLG